MQKSVNGTHTKCLKLRLAADEAISAVESICGVIMKHVSHTWLLRVIYPEFDEVQNMIQLNHAPIGRRHGKLHTLP